MPAKKTLNPKRLTKKQVKELVDSVAVYREDLSNRLGETYASGDRTLPAVYELPEDRFLYVFDADSGIGGKGDIYPGDYFRRKVRWVEKVREDATHGRNGSVAHWMYYSKHKTELVFLIDVLIAQLSADLALSLNVLDKTYASLDAVSQRVELLGVERAQDTIYDPLVAYVGEVLRQRTGGVWAIDKLRHYPYICSETRSVLMPINVVWGELDGLEPVNLRSATANEVRRATARSM